ncbi:MAG: POTRA domain-containing protein, partial [Bacteroidota bacterium]
LGWKAGVNIVSAGFFCFILTVVPSAAAQDSARVASITIDGMHHRSESEILGILHTRAAQPFRTAAFQQDLKRLVAWYGEEGFLEASVDSVHSTPTPEGLHITVVLNEGKQAVVGPVSFEGNRVFTHYELEAAIETRRGAPFSFFRIESDIQSLLKRYEDAGFSFAKIAVKDIALERGEETRALITLTIDEGRQVLVSEVRVEGNKSTRDFVIVREARLKENDIFRGDMARRVQRRLERLQLFASVSEPELYLTEDGRGGLLVKVSEGNPNFFDGIVGYSPSQRQGEDGFFNGLIDVQFRNILGTGRKLSTRWYRENRISQEIELHYFEPWVASAPVNLGAGFFQRKQDSTYVRTSLDVHTEFMFNEELSMGLSAQQTDVTPTEGFGRSIVPETKNLSFGFSVEYDSRDNPAAPTGGVFYRTDYQVGTKRIVSAFST